MGSRGIVLGVASQCHAPTTVRPGKRPGLLDGPQSRSGQMRKISLPHEFFFVFFCTLFLTSSVLVSLSWLSWILPLLKTQNTNTHIPGGIRTRSPTKGSAGDSRLRPLGHWDRLILMPTAVTHPSTNHAQRCITVVIRREPVLSKWYGCWQGFEPQTVHPGASCYTDCAIAALTARVKQSLIDSFAVKRNWCILHTFSWQLDVS